MSTLTLGVDVQEFVTQVGKAAANSLYPAEFEYYLCAFELVDSTGALVDYFVFPIMPASIRRSEGKVKTIKKAFGGVAVVKTASFVPVDFSLSGTLGRQLKVLIGGSNFELGSGLRQSTVAGVFGKKSWDGLTPKTAIFNSKIKTGYGATKVLQAILDKADDTDQYGKPLILHFYNMAFGEAYVVEVRNHSFSQDEGQSNMIWRYSVNLTAVAPLTISKSLKSLPFTFAASQTAASIFTRTMHSVWDASLTRY